MSDTRIYDDPPQLLLRMEQVVPNKRAQQGRILALLQSKDVVTLPEIMDLRIACHTKRLSELRKMGYDIRCETEWIGGIRHSKYHLVRP